MKKITTVGLLLGMFFFIAVQSTTAQSNNAVNMFKKHVNGVVQKVEKAETPDKKRNLLNTSFEKLLATFDKVENMQSLSQADRASLNKLRANVTEKKNELNGHDGFKRVADNQLNNFANFVQQDIEQADETITISVTVLLLIVIILLLL